MTTVKTYLTEAYAIDNKSILRILTQDKQINKADPNYKYYVQLANWASSNGRQQRLKNIELDKINLSDRELITKGKLANRLTTLGHTLNALKNLMDREGAYNPNSELSKLIQQTTLEILAGLSGIPAPKKIEEPEEPEPEEDEEKEEDPAKPDPDPKASKGRDWTAYRAQKLANANGKPVAEVLKDFYDEYYRVEYASMLPGKEQIIIDKLKSLDKILTIEFNKLGYNPEANPFAAFLKILIKEKFDDIFEKLTYNTYGAIHNAFIEKKITGNMLGNDPVKIGKENILFCSDLYKYKGLDIVEYLSLQNQALKSAEGKDYAKDKSFLSKMFIQQRFDDDKSYAENIKALFDVNNTNITKMSAGGAKLKSLLEIRELYNHIFGTAAKKTVDTDTINKILDDAIKQGIAQDLLWFILMQKGFTKIYKQTTDTAKNVLKKLGSDINKIDFDKVQQLLDDYDDLSLAVEKKMADSLIAHLAEKLEKAGAKA